MKKFLLICISIFMGISTSVLANGNLETEPLVQNESYGTSYDYVENQEEIEEELNTSNEVKSSKLNNNYNNIIDKEPETTINEYHEFETEYNDTNNDLTIIPTLVRHEGSDTFVNTNFILRAIDGEIKDFDTITFEHENGARLIFKAEKHYFPIGNYNANIFLVELNQSGNWKIIEYNENPIDSSPYTYYAYEDINEYYLHNDFFDPNIPTENRLDDSFFGNSNRIEFNEYIDNFALQNNNNKMTVYRYAGSDGYQTAIKVSSSHFTKSENVIITNINSYNDSLATINLSTRLNAPILFSDGSSLNNDTRKEIEKLGVKNAYIIGGPVAIKSSVEKDLKRIGLVSNVTRIYGSNANETAVELAKFAKKIQVSKYMYSRVGRFLC